MRWLRSTDLRGPASSIRWRQTGLRRRASTGHCHSTVYPHELYTWHQQLVFVKAAAAQRWENLTDLVRLKTHFKTSTTKTWPDTATWLHRHRSVPELCGTSVCCSMTNFLWSSKIASTCFYLRRLRQLRCLLGPEVTAKLVSAFIMSRVDCCNSVLAGLPITTLDSLRRVQNAAARLILSLNLVTT